MARIWLLRRVALPDENAGWWKTTTFHVEAPVNLTVNGNVKDPDKLAALVRNDLNDVLTQTLERHVTSKGAQ